MSTLGSPAGEAAGAAAGPGRGGRLARLERLARALNEAADAAVTTGVDGDDLDAAVAAAEGLVGRLRSRVDADPWTARAAEPLGRSGPTEAFARYADDLGRVMPVNAVVGPYNPIAPPVRLWTADGVVRGTTTLGPAYMGPPGLVHGGVVASVLDQLLGMAPIVGGRPGFTGTLTVRFRRGTPIDTELSLEARLTRVSGRRSHAWGAISAGGEVTAEAEGVFVAPAAGPLGRGR